MPRRLALTLYQGNEEELAVTALDETTGLAYDLSDVSSIRMVIKTSKETSDASALDTLTTTDGDIEITDAADGEFTVTVPTSATENAGVFWYRIDAYPGPKTILFGPLTIEDT